LTKADIFVVCWFECSRRSTILFDVLRGVYMISLRYLLVLMVMFMGIFGETAYGALKKVQTPVPAITYVSPTTKGNITTWRGWITIFFPDGRKVSGYADWRGYPDTIPLNDPNTWIYSGSDMSWRLLSDTERKGIMVKLELIDLSYSNGPYKPGSKSTGF
jgi:hypothetical protein